MLTPKQSRFVEEYLVDLSATAAAVRAGYSDKFANRQASHLLGKPAVAAAIDAAKEQRSIETGVTSRWLLRRLVAEAEAKISDLFNEKNDLRPVAEWPEIWKQGLVTGLDIEALYNGHGEQVGFVKKIRFSDRVRRLELIGKHVKVNAFQDTVQHKGLDGLGDRLERAFKRLHNETHPA